MLPRRSLGRWLSSWLAVQSFAGLGLVCLLVYTASSFSISARQAEELQHKQELVRHLVDEMASLDDLPSLRHKLDDFFVGHVDIGLSLADETGTPVYLMRPVRNAGKDLHRFAFEMPAPWLPTSTLKAELTLDVSADTRLLNQLAWTLLASALVGALLISAGGAWLVRQALLSVHDLARQTAALAPENVGRPLDGSAQVEELQPLVTQFNALLSRLDGAYRQLEGFNADVAHELRTPLAILIGETELALNRKRSTEELKEVLASNLEDLHRLASLVNDMLFLSRADRGERARRSPIESLAALATDVVDFHEAALLEAGIRARVRGDAAGTFDTALLRQALSNLLANATRFARHGSTVDIDIATDLAGNVQLSVTNSGPRIPAEHIPRIFERFYRADQAREHGGSRHGLGLSIVAAIARMHGGSPFARSVAGSTTIGFRFPAQAEESRGDRSQAPRHGQGA